MYSKEDLKMTQLQSWKGILTKWYERNLNLDGGYARRVNKNKKSSILNSEYIVSTDSGLKIVARSGKLIRPILQEPHYLHYYGNPQLLTPNQKKIIRQRYNKLKR